MPLTKVKKNSNMYQGWVTHTHSHLRGMCPHECGYCYVQAAERRFGGGHYTGPLRLELKEFDVAYGTGKTIFMEHCNDLFARQVPLAFTEKVLAHCRAWPENTYVFQTKNPAKMAEFLEDMPPRRILGATIESNRWHDAMGYAPDPRRRLLAMRELGELGERTFITIEPVMDFDVEDLAKWMREAAPCFVNIGADSKGSGLDEPDGEKVRALVALLNAAGIEIKEKHNLARLVG